MKYETKSSIKPKIVLIFKITIDKFGKNNHNITRKMLPDKSVSGGGMTKFITN